MSETITLDQYKEITSGPRGRIQYHASKTGLIKVKEDIEPEDGESVIRHHLRAMGHYFDLDEKSVKFYIRQLELSKKS